MEYVVAGGEVAEHACCRGFHCGWEVFHCGWGVFHYEPLGHEVTLADAAGVLCGT